MAEEQKNSGAVPPRLDLRKGVTARPPSVQGPAAPVQPSPISVQTRVAPVSAAPVVPVAPVSPAQPVKPVSVNPMPVSPVAAAVAPKPDVPVSPAQPVKPVSVNPMPVSPVAAAVAPKPDVPVITVPKPASAAVGGPQTVSGTSTGIRLSPAQPRMKPLAPSGAVRLQPGGPVRPAVPQAPAPAVVSPDQVIDKVAEPVKDAVSVQPVVPVPQVSAPMTAPVSPVVPAAAPAGVPGPAGIRPAGGVGVPGAPGVPLSVKPAAGGVNPLRPASAGALGPRPVAKPTLRIGAAGPISQQKTIRLKAGAGPQPKAVALTPAEHDAKKETSKIPLEAAKPAQGIDLAAAGPAAGVINSDDLDDAKRKTSRISLESVLEADDAGKADAGSSAPKTIKLKRPSEAVTIKAIKKAPMAVGVRPAAPIAADLSKTAPLDDVADSAAAAGKRTVKVRRPSIKVQAGGGVPGGSPAGVAGAPGSKAGGAVAEPEYVDSAHWVFWLFSLAAVLVVCVTVYMFTSQVIGPNYSLTKASFYTEGYDLSWPYKLRRMP